MADKEKNIEVTASASSNPQHPIESSEELVSEVKQSRSDKFTIVSYFSPGPGTSISRGLLSDDDLQNDLRNRLKYHRRHEIKILFTIFYFLSDFHIV